MGSLAKLKSNEKNVHILYTNSNLSELYVYDTLKEKCKANRDSIFDVSTKNSIVEMLDLVNIQSFLSDKWLFVLDYGKVKSVIKDKKGIFESSNSEFLIKVKNYKEFKEVKEELSTANDLYLAYVKYTDVEFLFQGFNISPKMVNFISKSYSSDIEQVFVLLNEMKNGLVVESRKQIVSVCGISSGSLTSYAISLLKDFPTTDRGFKTVCRNRIKVGVELADTYGFNKMRNFLLASVKDILDIKQLYLEGVIYDRISNIPDCYDEKRLLKNRVYLESIKSIPYDRITYLYLLLRSQGLWYKDIDMINFIYSYYSKGGKSYDFS